MLVWLEKKQRSPCGANGAIRLAAKLGTFDASNLNRQRDLRLARGAGFRAQLDQLGQ